MDLETLRHSASHVMADAVKSLYPKVRLGIGPAIENGFYYDFDKEEPFTDGDLVEIEARMRQIIAKDQEFTKETLTKKKAAELFKARKEPYKLELINELEGDAISIYRHGEFVDMCKGPHAKSTGEIKAFKLLSVAGAYWRGNENNPMLQRIYGTAFDSDKELRCHLHLIEEAKKRDHRKLGKELDYFSVSDEIGAGLVLYHPKGAMLRTIVEDYIKREHIKRGYNIVIGPHILKSDIWIKSGHYDYYKENMYIFKIDTQEFAIKPMNCPGHMLVYRSRMRSYRDLPFRLFELGTVYRNEKGGVLHGLLRVRGFTQDDAHIFCLKEQLRDEIVGVIDFVSDTLKVFGFDKFEVELSTRPPKSIGSDSDWEEATSALKGSLDRKGLAYEINEGEGAFYGPKIDIKLKDALGRSWQCATIQCDFVLPDRFDLSYIDSEGKKIRPVMIHRVILGSIERFIGALMEHYGGAFPLWLSPEQVRVIPITSIQVGFANDMMASLRDNDIRVNMDERPEKMQKKIRDAEIEKIPVMAIVGAKEAASGSVSVRSKQKGDLGVMKVEEFVMMLKKAIVEKQVF
ncbi:MAG: threonine--tRNA ligase [Candidatus Omnitrophota bacterium]